MGFTTTIDLAPVAHGLTLPLEQVESVVRLLDAGNTIPFITRYRKDQTGGLDEEQIRQIQDRGWPGADDRGAEADDSAIDRQPGEADAGFGRGD